MPVDHAAAPGNSKIPDRVKLGPVDRRCNEILALALVGTENTASVLAWTHQSRAMDEGTWEPSAADILGQFSESAVDVSKLSRAPAKTRRDVRKVCMGGRQRLYDGAVDRQA